MRMLLMASVALICCACQSTPKTQALPATEEPPDTAPDCRGRGQANNRDDCLIRVIVKETGGKCTVEVEPSQDEVTFDQYVRNRWILWKIESNVAGYRFPRNGIAFKQFTFGNFTRGRPLQRFDDRIYVWRNGNGASGNGDWPYDVRVERVVSAQQTIRCDQDPRIRNR